MKRPEKFEDHLSRRRLSYVCYCSVAFKASGHHGSVRHLLETE